jgi:hypothetical protein
VKALESTNFGIFFGTPIGKISTEKGLGFCLRVKSKSHSLKAKCKSLSLSQNTNFMFLPVFVFLMIKLGVSGKKHQILV